MFIDRGIGALPLGALSEDLDDLSLHCELITVIKLTFGMLGPRYARASVVMSLDNPKDTR